jgi:NAD+ kinase
MGDEFRKVAILGRHDDARVEEPMNAVARHLTEHGVRVFAAEDNRLDIGATIIAEERFCAEVDLVIAIGGDGTMLYAASIVAGSDIPLLGVNRGRLGFLADVTPDEMLTSLDHVLAGNYTRDTRLMLEALLVREDGSVARGHALNDVVIVRRETGRMLDFETSIAGVYVNTHSGDGLVVSTPTGSTAYSLSCGGPIIEPQLDAIVIVPVCPHTLTDRPIVIPSSQPIDVSLLERDDLSAEITIDGHSLGEFRSSDKLTIEAADNRITFIHPPGYDYFEILRTKLYWGRDIRNRGDRARKS